MIVVDKPAPDFEGKLTKVNLSDYRGKWVLVCFYPGDFTYERRTENSGRD